MFCRSWIDEKSGLIFPLVDQADAGFAFPLVIHIGLSFQFVRIDSEASIQKQGVEDAQDKIVKDLGMAPVYLVSNDAAVAAKEAAKSTPVSKYTDMAKEQLDMFMKMTPEDREQAMMAGLDLMDSVGPEYYSSIMQTMMNTNPEKLQRLQARGTDMLFSMSTEQRRAMIKMNMGAMKNITPEQMKILQDDAAAIAEEIKNEQPAQPGQ